MLRSLSLPKSKQLSSKRYYYMLRSRDLANQIEISKASVKNRVCDPVAV